MRYNQFLFILMFFFTLALSCSMEAQSWDFIKEKDGIKIYTRKEAGKSLRSYRGVTRINEQAEKIFALMEDINTTDWWDKNLTQIKVLLYEKYKRAQYYMVYNLPWPVIDRDLCVDITITIDQVTGEYRINVVSSSGVVPQRDDMVRIKDYRQTWTIIPAGKEMSDVVLEGFIDPGGSIPDWISNRLIIDSPFKTISGLKEKMQKNEDFK